MAMHVQECVVRAAKKRPDMAAVYSRLQQLARQDLDAQHKRKPDT
jgi:hypothetical protein